jgi:haloalkane dehalogenase
MAPQFLAAVPTAASEPRVVLADAGHFVQEDAGRDLADAVADFVARHPGR